MRLAIVASHPTQYYAPWFAFLHLHSGIQLRVFYLWDFGVRAQIDTKFNQVTKWDIDLLSGYECEFVSNVAKEPGTGSFNGLDNPDLFPRLRAWQPDCVLSFGYGWKTLLNLARHWSDTPLVLRGDNHQLGRERFPWWKETLRRWSLNHLLKKYAAFACVGQANRTFYQHHGVDIEKLHFVPHCVDNDRFARTPKRQSASWRETLGIGPQEQLILFSGKFEPTKKPDLLLTAFLKADLPNSRLVFTGSGELEGRLRDMSAIRPDSVVFAGFVNQSMMPAALAAADLLVLPSYGAGETWGLIINESMAAGTPVVVSDHVGCAADLVIPGETGWTFPAGDEQSLIDVLKTACPRLAADPQAFHEATQAQIAKYSYKAATQGLIDLLADLPALTPS